MFTQDELDMLYEAMEFIEMELDNSNADEMDDYEELVAIANSIKEKLNAMYREVKGGE